MINKDVGLPEHNAVMDISCSRGERKNSSDFSDTGEIKEESSSQRSNGMTESKKFVCDICDASFTMIGNLNRHKKGHSNHRPYTCNFCLRGFLRRTSYNEHIRLHTGEKPYQCEICLQTFVRKKCHQMHTRKCKENGAVSAQERAAFQASDSLSRLNLLELQRQASISATQILTKPAMTGDDQPLDLSSKHLSYDFLREHEVQQAKISEIIKAGLQFYLPFSTLGEPLVKADAASTSSSLSTNSSSSYYDYSPLTGNIAKQTVSPILSKKVKPCTNGFSPLAAERVGEMESMTLEEVGDAGHHQLWPCKVCQVYFSDATAHKKHMEYHDIANPLSCTKCSKVCTNSDQFLIHH